MAAAALAGLELRGDEKYGTIFRRAHRWFHGQNSLEQPLADVQRGACFDGLQSFGVNRNQGAESTLAFLWTELQDSALNKRSSPVLKVLSAASERRRDQRTEI